MLQKKNRKNKTTKEKRKARTNKKKGQVCCSIKTKESLLPLTPCPSQFMRVYDFVVRKSEEPYGKEYMVGM